jgi:hypothetical protein
MRCETTESCCVLGISELDLSGGEGGVQPLNASGTRVDEMAHKRSAIESDRTSQPPHPIIPASS